MGTILFLSGQHIFIVMIVVLLLFGADKIPEVAKGIGKGMRDFKKATDDIRKEIEESTRDIRGDMNDIQSSIRKDVNEISLNVRKQANDISETLKNDYPGTNPSVQNDYPAQASSADTGDNNKGEEQMKPAENNPDIKVGNIDNPSYPENNQYGDPADANQSKAES